MEELYYRYRNWVIKIAYSFCRNENDAEDVLQEVFKHFFNQFPGFKLTSKLKTYLYPVIRSRAIDILRKNQRRVLLENSDETFQKIADSSADPESSRKNVAEMVCQLPVEQREVIIFRFVDGYSLKEIAEELKIPTGTAKSRLHNALVGLKKLFLIFFYFLMNLFVIYFV